MAEEIMVHEVKLGSGKTVLLRDFKIRHMELAVKAAGDEKSEYLFALKQQNELIKILLVQVDGQDIDRTKVEDLDNYFSVSEYKQIMQVVKQLSGDDDEMGKPTVTVSSFGGK